MVNLEKHRTLCQDKTTDRFVNRLASISQKLMLVFNHIPANVTISCVTIRKEHTFILKYPHTAWGRLSKPGSETQGMKSTVVLARKLLNANTS